MEANSTTTNDGDYTESTDLRELMRRIHAKKVRAGAWDFIDPKYPENGPMIAPMMVDNRKKLLIIANTILRLCEKDAPQEKEFQLSYIIRGLLDFCAAHRIDVSTYINDTLR